MRGVRSAALLLASVGILFVAAGAEATPITYNFSSGQAAVSATFGATTLGPVTFPLNGVQVTFDATALTLPSFQFTAGTGPVALPGVLSGTSLALSFDIAPSTTGYSSSASGSNPYSFTAGPVMVSGSATLSGGITGTKTLSFTNPTLSGQIQITSGGDLTLNGITLGKITLPAWNSFPGGSVTLTTNVTFVGLAVPEPSTGALLAIGLTAFARSACTPSSKAKRWPGVEWLKTSLRFAAYALPRPASAPGLDQGQI
jgi:hypothetical protein